MQIFSQKHLSVHHQNQSPLHNKGSEALLTRLRQKHFPASMPSSKDSDGSTLLTSHERRIDKKHYSGNSDGRNSGLSHKMKVDTKHRSGNSDEKNSLLTHEMMNETKLCSDNSDNFVIPPEIEVDKLCSDTSQENLSFSPHDLNIMISLIQTHPTETSLSVHSK